MQVTQLYTCCPQCGGDLVELPHGLYSVIECARACGWWDEKHPVTKPLDAPSRDDRSGNKDRLGAALKWAESQAPRCGICGDFEHHKLKWGGRKALARDHCHKTNRQRGLLCSSCNMGLGLFRDDPALLASAIKYLDRNRR
ncbi:MAG: endonuclease domain-containing protein [Candidatus Binataceae bacterium]